MDNSMKELLLDIDAAFATLNIGRDHGITPQAASACRKAWAKVNEALNDPEMAEVILDNAFQNCHCE